MTHNSIVTFTVTSNNQHVEGFCFHVPDSDQRLHLFFRPKPAAGETKPWSDTSISNDDFMAQDEMVEMFVQTNMFTYLTESDEITVTGVKVGAMADSEIEDVKNGTRCPKTVKDGAEGLLKKEPPRSWRFNNLAETAKWLTADLFKDVREGNPLTDYEVHPLETATVTATPTVEVEGDKVELMAGQDDYYLRSGFAPGKSDVELQVQAFDLGWAIAYLGPPGTGKTTLIQASAKVWRGDSVIEIVNGGPDIRMHHIVGNWVFDQSTGTWKWIDGPLLRAMKRGTPILIDEFGRIPQDVMTIFYPLLDGRNQISVDDNLDMGIVEATEGFAMAFASNPDHPSFELDEPLASRFAAMPELLTDWDLMRRLVGGKGKAYAAIVDACENLDKQRQNKTLYFTPQARDVVRLAKKADVWGLPVALSELITRVGRIGTENDAAEVTETLERALDKRGLTTLKVGG